LAVLSGWLIRLFASSPSPADSGAILDGARQVVDVDLIAGERLEGGHIASRLEWLGDGADQLEVGRGRLGLATSCSVVLAALGASASSAGPGVPATSPRASVAGRAGAKRSLTGARRCVGGPLVVLLPRPYAGQRAARPVTGGAAERMK